MEKANPFARAQVRFSPNHEREGIGAHGGSAPSRLQRKGSRSKSASGVDTQRQPWHVEANPSCNGGLANAIDSVRERVRRRLWVGTLGTTTDGFGEAVRRDIDARMLDEWDSVPVWIPDAEFSKCYDEFCHQVRSGCLFRCVAVVNTREAGALASAPLCNPGRSQD